MYMLRGHDLNQRRVVSNMLPVCTDNKLPKTATK